MGFLAKLYDKYVPLTDETVKTYYEIVYGLLCSVGKDYHYGISYHGIKKYLEYHLKEQISEEKLRDTLEYFECALQKSQSYRLRTEGEWNSIITGGHKKFSQQKIKKLQQINQELNEAQAFRCTLEEVDIICHKDALDAIQVDYDAVIKVVEKQGIKFFVEGLDNIRKKHQNMFHWDKIEYTIHKLTKQYYFDGNNTVKTILLAFLQHALWKQQDMNMFASVALRAMNFEAFKGDESEYKTFSDEQCRIFVQNNPAYASEIAEHPYETEEYTNNLIERISKSSIFGWDNYWMPYCGEMQGYYADSVCYHFWKSISQDDCNGSTKDANEVFNMIMNRIQAMGQ